MTREEERPGVHRPPGRRVTVQVETAAKTAPVQFKCMCVRVRTHTHIHSVLVDLLFFFEPKKYIICSKFKSEEVGSDFSHNVGPLLQTRQ